MRTRVTAVRATLGLEVCPFRPPRQIDDGACQGNKERQLCVWKYRCCKSKQAGDLLPTEVHGKWWMLATLPYTWAAAPPPRLHPEMDSGMFASFRRPSCLVLYGYRYDMRPTVGGGGILWHFVLAAVSLRHLAGPKECTPSLFAKTLGSQS